MNILIVDDETDLAQTLSRFLAQFGHDCVTAPDVRRAIDSMAENRPDLVLTDLNLPDGNGFDVIKHVRKTLHRAHAILMTAYHWPGIEQALEQAGASTYLRKPFALADLREAVEAV